MDLLFTLRNFLPNHGIEQIAGMLGKSLRNKIHEHEIAGPWLVSLFDKAKEVSSHVVTHKVITLTFYDSFGKR